MLRAALVGHACPASRHPTCGRVVEASCEAVRSQNARAASSESSCPTVGSRWDVPTTCLRPLHLPSFHPGLGTLNRMAAWHSRRFKLGKLLV